MRGWCQRCGSTNIYEENGLMVNDAPSSHDQEVCRELGRALAKW